MAPKGSGTQLIQDLGSNVKGRTILVTGTTHGSIGALYAEKVAQASPSTLILQGRSINAIQKTIDATRTANSSVAVKHLLVDFSSLEGVRAAAAEVNSWGDVDHIDLLVNNAGVMASPWGKTKEGFETQLGINHLGPFLFTNLIMDKVLASKEPRVLVVSSDGHRLSPIRWADHNFQDGRTYNRWRAYGQSKTANNLFAVGLATRLGGKGLQAFSCHPGVYMGSNLGRDVDFEGDGFASMQTVDKDMGNRFSNDDAAFDPHTEDEIVSTMIFGSFSRTLKGHNGAHLHSCRVADQWKEEVWPWSIDKVEAEKLWALSQKFVGQEFEY